MLKKGDRVSLGMAPPVCVDTYKNLKPSAIISRELGDNPDADLKEMEVELRGLYYRALCTEIDVFMDVHQVYGGMDTIEEFKKHCMAQVGHTRPTVKKVNKV